jgi:hypothetical protein
MKTEDDMPLQLETAWDWHKEISRCAIEIRKTEQEYDEWMANNPGGSWPGPDAKLARLHARKQEAEAKFEELTVRTTT